MFGWLKGKGKRNAAGERSRSSGRRTDGVVLRARDCHTHVIPGIDDGSRTMDESLQMLRLLASEGVRTVVATSHMFPARFDNRPDDLARGFEALVAATEQASIDLELVLGAEHYLDEGFVERVRAGTIVPFGPERYVLVETTTGAYEPTDLTLACHELADRGYVPLLAHVERYAYLRDEAGKDLVEDLRAAGAKFQVNRTVGKMNKPGVGGRGKMIAWLMDRGYIDEVGSDLHRATREGRPYAVG